MSSQSPNGSRKLVKLKRSSLESLGSPTFVSPVVRKHSPSMQEAYTESPPSKKHRSFESEDKKKHMDAMVDEVFKEFLTQKLSCGEKDQHKSKLKSLKEEAEREEGDAPASDEDLSISDKSPRHKKHKKDKKKDKKKEKKKKKDSDKEIDLYDDFYLDKYKAKEKEKVKEKDKKEKHKQREEDKFYDTYRKSKEKKHKKSKKKSKEREKSYSRGRGEADISKSWHQETDSWEDSPHSEKEKSPDIYGYAEFKRTKQQGEPDSSPEPIRTGDMTSRKVFLASTKPESQSSDKPANVVVSLDNNAIRLEPNRRWDSKERSSRPSFSTSLSQTVTKGDSLQISLTDIQLPPTPVKSPSRKDSLVVDLNTISLPSESKTGSHEDIKTCVTTEDSEVKTEPTAIKPVDETSQSSLTPSEETGAMKKAPIKLGIRISQTSAAIIQSGTRFNKEGKEMEDGEVDDSDEKQGDSLSDGESTGSFSDIPLEGDDALSRSSSRRARKHSKHKKKKSHKYDKDGKERKEIDRVKEKIGEKEKTADKSRSSRSRSRSPRKHGSKSRSRSRSKSMSFDKKRGIWRSRSKSRERHRCSRSRERQRSRSRSHSRDRHHRRDRHRRSRSRERLSMAVYKDFGWRPPRYRRSRSRSPDRTKDDLRLKIDKAKLREIAIANAYANMAQGKGPMVNLKPEEVAALKAGGKSVAELTDFCKNLARKDGDMSSSDEDGELRRNSDDDNDQEKPFIHHPFKVRDPSSIVLNIRNAKQLPVMSPAEKLAQTNTLRLQFPVSSGSQHRSKELEWVPVEKTTAPPTGTSTVLSIATAPTPVPMPMPGTLAAIMPPPPPPPLPAPAAPVVPVAPEDKVFPDPPQHDINIGAVVSQRLTALRKLQENPHDVEAMKIIFNAQKEMDSWAQSKQLPGQFLGSTGATILKPEELSGVDKRFQAWVKKDSFTKAEPVKGGIGMFLLQKMGWKQGEGLGKNKEGTTEPLMLDIKMDRKGLTSQEEMSKKNKNWGPTVVPGPPLPMPPKGTVNFLSGKHPVSALVEICTKRRWGSPSFTLVNENGPDHQKQFLFKVRVNGMEYQPAMASTNKKTAKAEAAACALIEMGYLPRNSPAVT